MNFRIYKRTWTTIKFYYKLKNEELLHKTTVTDVEIVELIKDIANDAKETFMKGNFYFLVDECDGYVNGGHWNYKRNKWIKVLTH